MQGVSRGAEDSSRSAARNNHQIEPRGSLCGLTPSDFVAQISSELVSVTKSRDWERLGSFLTRFLSSTRLPAEMKEAALITPEQGTGLRLLHYLGWCGAPSEIVQTVTEVVSEPGIPASGKIKGRRPVKNYTPLHFAAEAQQVRSILGFLRGGHPKDILNGRGEAPLHTYLKSLVRKPLLNSKGSFLGCRAFIRKGALLNIRTVAGEHPLAIAILGGKWNEAELLAQALSQGKGGKGVPLSQQEINYLIRYCIFNPLAGDELIGFLNDLISISPDREEQGDEDKITKHFSKLLFNSLPHLSDGIQHNWTHFLSVLERIDRYRSYFDESQLESLVNSRENPEERESELSLVEEFGMEDEFFPRLGEEITLLMSLCRSGAPPAVLRKLISLGAEVNGVGGYFVDQLGAVRHSCTALHVASYNGNVEQTKTLIETGADLNQLNGHGQNPLHSHLEVSARTGGPNISLILAYKDGGIDLKKKDDKGRSVYTVSSDKGTLAELITFLDKEGSEKQLDRTYIIYRDGEKVSVDRRELVAEVYTLARKLDGSFSSNSTGLLEDIEVDGSITKVEVPSFPVVVAGMFARRLNGIKDLVVKEFIEKGEIYSGYLFLKAATEILSIGIEPKEFAFTKLLPSLLFGHEQGVAHKLANRLEALMDTRANIRQIGPNNVNSHPFSTEFMVLLNHPGDYKRNSRSIGSYTSALSSITRWSEYGKKVNGRIAELWGDLGVFSMSFPLWRAEAERFYETDSSTRKTIVKYPSLLEQFGFELIEGRKTDFLKQAKKGSKEQHYFGPGYMLLKGAVRNMAPKTLLELRRAYIIVSSSSEGTLIIRNSSPIFGRDRLPEPALWSPRALSRKEIVGFQYKDLWKKDFSSVLDHSLFPENIGRITYLKEEVARFKETFSNWTFATGDIAWDSTDSLVGGYYSPGFKYLLDFLELREEEVEYDLIFHGESRRQKYDLTFVHRHYPPMSPYARLRVDKELIGTMRKLNRDQMVTEDEYSLTGLRKFFDIGFENAADLVLLPTQLGVD